MKHYIFHLFIIYLKITSLKKTFIKLNDNICMPYIVSDIDDYIV